MKEILFSNLSLIAENKKHLSEDITTKHWQAIDYEIGDICGKMLIVGEETFPPNMILTPNLNGWYRIYICTVKMDFTNRMNIKLSSDKAFSSVFPPKEGTPSRWAPYEYAQEFFWKCANMTNEKIEIRKPVVYSLNGVCIAWLRFEEMTDAEVKEYNTDTNSEEFKNAHYHFDGDEHTIEELNSANDVLTRLSRLENSDAEICSLEVTSDFDIIDFTPKTLYGHDKKAFSTGDKKFNDNKEKYYKEKIDFLHSINVNALAAFRMSLANFGADALGRIQTNFVDNHPELYCETRDGRTVQICSFAYREVWDYVINIFKESIKYGFDGISLILHRGIMINFEKPVIKRFNEKYPDVDPRTLPITDDRLNDVWCEFMTEFMRKLRKDINEFAERHVKINIITDFSPETAKHLGLDIEAWAKEGLIDCICQDTMELYEDIDDCLTEEKLIDLVKYKNKLKHTETVKRFHGHSIEKLLDGAKKYMKIAKDSGVKFYGGIFSWPSNTETILENQQKLKEIGVENFSVYNFVHLSVHQPFYHALANICHDKINQDYCKIKTYRVMTINGMDLSTYNPNWRG